MNKAKKNLLAKLVFAIMTSALPVWAATGALEKLPLFFEANGPAQFLSRGNDFQFLISANGGQFALRKSDGETAVAQMRFVGANPGARIVGENELPGKINYLLGNQPAQWRAGVSTFGKVSVDEIYPGVGLVYYGNQRRLEYDFTIAPKADPNLIAMRFDGVKSISVNAQGELILTLAGGEICQPKPAMYQIIGGARKEIIGGYKMLDARTVGFSIGNYDRALPLVIDPVLLFSTYFGGAADETAWAVAVNTNDGSIYVAGQTLSKVFTNSAPFSTTGAFQTNFQGGTIAGDAFVARLGSQGTNLIYLTYLGGAADDTAYGLAVDGAGNAFVTGFTDSANFPTTTNAAQPRISGKIDPNFGYYPGDAFVAELNSGGSNLIYSTYLGGNAQDYGTGIAVDSSGRAYVIGVTASTNFPTTTNALQSHLACTNSIYFNANAFVTEVSPGGSNLIFSTYFGGTNFDLGESVAVDGAGYIYAAGSTASTNFPATNFIYQIIGTNLYDGHLLNGSTNSPNFAFDAFAAKFYPSGVGLVYSTLLGGTNNDFAGHIACDAAGDAYVTGYSTSTNFPDTLTNIGLYSYVATNGLAVFATNAFLTEISSNGSAMIYSALFGGNGVDVGNGVAVDSAGRAFVVGAETSTNFPAANSFGSLAATNSGASDVFVTAFDTNGSALLYSVCLGGNNNDYGYGIAVDATDNVYVVGQTISANFPAFAAFQNKLNGPSDAFLAKIYPTIPPPVLTAALSGTNLMVTWPPFGEESPAYFKLVSNTNLISTNWLPVAQPPVTTNGVYQFQFSPANQNRFFRLRTF